jgi:predicted O-methyltransferase YrrM
MTRNEESKRLRYIRELFAVEDAPLADVKNVLEDDIQRMQVAPEEGKILHVLTMLSGAKNVVEVGVLAGYSAVWIARALPEDGHVYAIEKDSARIAGIEKNLQACGVANKVTLIHGDAHDELEKLASKAPFDMIFIDADKGGYPDYLNWAEHNIRKDGMIIGDNTFLFDHVYKEAAPKGWSKKNWEGMRHFNERLADSAKYTSILLPTAEGLTVAIKKF